MAAAGRLLVPSSSIRLSGWRMKRFWYLLVTLPVVLLAATGAHASTTTQTWACTAAAYQACSFSSDPGWDEYNNPWNDPAMPPNSYTLYANSHSDWEMVANQAACPTRDCAVEAYESAQFNYDNTPGSEEISGIRYMTSYFNQTMPTGNLATNGFDAEAAYDIWLDNYGIEVMIWVDNQGQTPAGQVIGTASLNGQRYLVYNSGNTYSFVISRNETSGTVNILAAFDWLTAGGYVPANSYLTQFNFGWEVASTAGKTDTFQVHNLRLSQAFK